LTFPGEVIFWKNVQIRNKIKCKGHAIIYVFFVCSVYFV